MNILAIDTASRYLSIAISIDGNVFETFKQVDNKHSDYILPEIEALLIRANMKINQIKYIAYNQGPGSFTGLRIGLSAALGLAYGINAKLIPIPAFVIHAMSHYEQSEYKDTKILVGLDARLGDLYLAGVSMPTLNYFTQPQVIKRELIDPKNNDDAIHIGDGFDQDAKYPSAKYLLDLVKSGKYQAVTCEDADLLYLRNKVALNLEEQRQSKINHASA